MNSATKREVRQHPTKTKRTKINIIGTNDTRRQGAGKITPGTFEIS